MKKFLLIFFSALCSLGSVWADTYTVTYTSGAGGTFNNSSGWVSTWVSSGTPKVTINSDKGFNSGNGNLAQKKFTISVEGNYYITSFKISSTADGWGAVVTSESGESETFSGSKEKTFSVGANKSSTYFTVSSSNFNAPTIEVYVEDIVNFASSVITNVKPHFDNKDNYFCLTSTALSTYESDYNTYKENCTEEQYTTLLNNVIGLYSNLNNVCLPNDGFYRLKNEDKQKYLYYEANLKFGDMSKAVSSVVYIHRDGNTFSLKLQGKYIQPPSTNQSGSVSMGDTETFFTPATSASTYNTGIGYAAINVGGRCFCANGSSTIWSWGTWAKGSHWTIEEAEDIEVSLSTVGNASYSTLYVDFPVEIPSSNENTAIYTLEESSGSYLCRKQTSVSAQTGIILRDISKASSVTLNIPASPSSATSALTGSLTTSEAPANCYIFGYTAEEGLGFYPYESGSSLAANKAYLVAGSNVRSFVLNFDDTETGINQAETTTQAGVVYDLQGRRTAKPQHGLYIVNGKKVLF